MVTTKSNCTGVYRVNAGPYTAAPDPTRRTFKDLQGSTRSYTAATRLHAGSGRTRTVLIRHLYWTWA
ncbi:hypothetical protein DPMN_131884 [Dreissena polymorpha]|uniref:Uncharacterized protein n=1 Tax=Dreissena polymorpha TaxID=45954 RepID=A0A9D4FQJ7_DREPO|nr:hypothetical protein DPMN_131884 [Dreissena polymorpha]